jgi:hypothetical protein
MTENEKPKVFDKPIRDIRKKDIDEAIRMMADNQNQREVNVRIKKPIKIEVSMSDSISTDVFHHYNDPQAEDVFLKISLIFFVLIASSFLVWWAMYHG